MVWYTCQLCNQYSTFRITNFNNHIITCVGTGSYSTNVNDTDNSNINNEINDNNIQLVQNIDQFTNDDDHHEILYSDHENSMT